MFGNKAVFRAHKSNIQLTKKSPVCITHTHTHTLAKKPAQAIEIRKKGNASFISHNRHVFFCHSPDISVGYCSKFSSKQWSDRSR